MPKVLNFLIIMCNVVLGTEKTPGTDIYVIKSAEEKVQSLSWLTDAAAVEAAMIDVVATILKASVRDVIPLDDLEIRRDKDYACGSQGSIRGVDQMLLIVDDKDNKNKNATAIEMTYKYSILYFKYLEFTHKTPWAPRRTGSCEITLESIKFILYLNKPTLKTLPSRISDKQCILSVLGLIVDELDNVYGYLEFVSNFRGKNTAEKLDEIIDSNKYEFKQLIKNRVKAEVYRSLAASGGWVCRDDTFIGVINQKPPVRSKKGTSDDFDKYCPQYNSPPLPETVKEGTTQ